MPQTNCDQVTGWAFDQDNWRALRVRVYKDALPAFGGTLVGEVIADDPGPGGFVPGPHSFTISIAGHKDYSRHNYWVTAFNVNRAGVETGEEVLLPTGNPQAIGPCLAPPGCSSLLVTAGDGTDWPEPSEPFSARVGFQYPGAPPSASFNYTIATSFPGVVNGGQTFTGTYPANGSSHTFTGMQQPLTGVHTGNWTVTITGNSPFPVAGANPPQSFNCSDQYTVARKPYTKVHGGDVRAGGIFTDNAATCSAANANPALQQSGVVYGWDKVNAGAYSGASTQYAAFAMGTIQNFFTAANRGGMGSPALPPDDLAFGNESASPGTGNYGGNYGQAQCVHDYFADSVAAANGGPGGSYALPPGTAPPVLLTPASGQVRINGTVTGTHVIYVRGDLLIDGNITFAPYGSVAATPSIYFIVQGNILIRHDVSQIAGIFIAQPRPGVPDSGKIFTCVRPDGSKFTAAQIHNGCGTQLTVNGAFVANQVRLLRTFNTLRAAVPGEGHPGNAAEVFKYSPQLYLATPHDILRRGGRQPFDAIISLPPIL